MGALCKASRWEEWDGYLSPTMFDLEGIKHTCSAFLASVFPARFSRSAG